MGELGATSDLEAALLSYNGISSSSWGGDSKATGEIIAPSSLQTRHVSPPPSPSHSFTSFLALVQSINVDFLPITWHSALVEARRGGTAQLQQMAVDLENAFAFKRLSPLHGEKGPQQLQALNTEVSVLGHPAVQRCENVIALEGIAWDVEHKSGQVWPVLVFQKAPYSDLMAFIRNGEGSALGFGERLELLADVLVAQAVLHENYIVHGDIKPQNVLVFCGKESQRKYVARLADFGYSGILSGEGATYSTRGTKLWAAPEYIHDTAVAFEAARRMDVFSIGCLGLWLLFYDKSHVKSPMTIPDFLAHHQAHASFIDIVLSYIEACKELGSEIRTNLTSFFEKSLRRDPAARTVECRTLLALIDSRRARDMELPVQAAEVYGYGSASFKISKSLSQFLLADYRVRQYIFRSLKDIAKPATSAHKYEGVSDAYGTQLALCYKIGFGTKRDESALKTVMEDAGITEAALEGAVAEAARDSEGPQFHSLIYREMVEVGKDFRVDFDAIHQLEGHLEDAIKQHTIDMENLTEVFGSTHILTLVVTAALCYALHTAGDWDAAIALRIKMTEMLTEVKGKHSRDTLSSKSRLAAMYIDLDRWDEAEEILEEVREVQMNMTTAEDHETIETAHALAEVYRRQAKWKEAEELLLPALEERQRSLGPIHPDTLRLVSKVASLHLSQRRFDEAQKLLEDLVRSRKERLGDRHRETLSAMANLATVYYHQDKLEEAERLYKHVEAVRVMVQGEEHKETLILRANLASLFKRLGKYTEAESLEERVLQVKIRKFGKENRSTLVTQGNLALTYAYQEKWEEAIALGREVVDAKRKGVGPGHPDTLKSVCNLAEAYMGLHQMDEAKSVLLQGYQDALDAGRAGQFDIELLEGLLYEVHLSENEKEKGLP